MAKEIKYPHVRMSHVVKHPGHIRPIVWMSPGRPGQYLFEADGSSPIFVDNNAGVKQARAYARRWIKNNREKMNGR